MLRRQLFTQLTKVLYRNSLILSPNKPNVAACNHVVKLYLSDKKPPDDNEKFGGRFGVLYDRVLKKITDSNSDIREQNGFKLFNLEQKFAINLNELQKEMHNLQRIVHPDRFVNSSGKSQETSDYLSALINEYYQVLEHPYERAKYLLSLITTKSREDIDKRLENLEIDQEFLSNMMDIQLKLEDRMVEMFEIEKMSSFLSNELDELTLELDRDFSEKNIESIFDKLGKLKFLTNCHRKAAKRLDTFSRY